MRCTGIESVQIGVLMGTHSLGRESACGSEPVLAKVSKKYRNGNKNPASYAGFGCAPSMSLNDSTVASFRER